MARPRDDYFESYGQTGKSYTQVMRNSVVNSTNILRAWTTLVEQHFGKRALKAYRIKSFLDVGAATGRLVAQFARVCDVALGVEFATWPQAHLPAQLRSRMLWGDFLAHGRLWTDCSFDLIFDSSAMYADTLRECRKCLAEVHRLAAKGALFYYYDMTEMTVDEIRTCDRYAGVLPPREQWIKMVWDAGFDVVQPWTFQGRYYYDVIFGLKRVCS